MAMVDGGAVAVAKVDSIAATALQSVPALLEMLASTMHARSRRASYYVVEMVVHSTYSFR